MFRNNQKGIVHLFIIIILLAGIIVGVYLVQKTQIFKPKAYDLSNLTITDSSGIKLPNQVADPNVHILIRLPQKWEAIGNHPLNFVSEARAQSLDKENSYKRYPVTMYPVAECSSGHDKYKEHLDLIVDSDVMKMEDNIWITIEEPREKKALIVAVVGWGYSTFTLHESINPIKGEYANHEIRILPETTYNFKAYRVPLTGGEPNLDIPIAEAVVTTPKCKLPSSELLPDESPSAQNYTLKEIIVYNNDQWVGGADPLHITSDFQSFLNKPIPWKLNPLAPDADFSKDLEYNKRVVKVEFRGILDGRESFFSAEEKIDLESTQPNAEDEILVDVIIDQDYAESQKAKEWAKDTIDLYLNEKLTGFGIKRKLKFNSVKVEKIEAFCGDAWKNTVYDLKNNRIRMLLSNEFHTSYAVPWQDWTCISAPQIESDTASNMQGVILHEFGHLLGLPDYYFQDVFPWDNQVAPVGITSETKDVMWRTEPYFDNNSIKIINNLSHSLPGNIDAWKYYAPKNLILQILGNGGLPLPQAKVEVFPQTMEWFEGSLYPRLTIPNVVSFERVTDNTGRVYLGDQENLFRHHRIANALSGGSALIKVTYQGEVRYATITLSQLNYLYFDKGQTSFAMLTVGFDQLVKVPEDGDLVSISSFNRITEPSLNEQQREEAGEHLLQHLRVSGYIK